MDSAATSMIQANHQNRGRVATMKIAATPIAQANCAVNDASEKVRISAE